MSNTTFTRGEARQFASRIKAKYGASDGIPDDADDDSVLQFHREVHGKGLTDEQWFSELDKLDAPVPPKTASPVAEPKTSFREAVGSFVGDVAKRVGENVKQAVTHPVETAKGIVTETAKDIGSIPGAIYSLQQPGRVAELLALVKVAPDSPAGQDAKKELDRLVRAGALGASVLVAGPAGGLARGAVARAALGAGAGMATYSGVKAAGAGAPAQEVAKEALASGVIGAGLGAGGGLAAKAIRGMRTGAPAPEVAPTRAPVRPGVPEPSILDLAAQHQAEARFVSSVAQVARSKGMEPADLLALVKQEAPSIQDLAAASQRYGITAQDLGTLRASMPEPIPTPAVERGPSLATPLQREPIPQGPSPVVERLTSAIKAAKPLQAAQAKLISAERSRRLGQAMGAQARVGGEAGYFAALSKLKGVMPKAQFESVRSVFSQPEIDELFNVIGKNDRLTGFEKVSAQGALQKLLGTDGAVAVPTRGELALLHEVYGKEFVQAALSKRTLLQQAGAVVGDALNVPRSIMASFDMSAPLRQGILTVTRPEFWKNLAPMVRSFASENFYRTSMDEIRSRPTYQTMREAGVSFTDIGGLSPHEEVFHSSMAEKVPGIRHSARAYTGFINRVRADVFDSVLKHAQEAGVDVTDPTFLQSLGTWINTATGRGDLGMLAPAGNALGTALFSPRLLASRINALRPDFYLKLDPFVRQQALRAHLSAAAAVTGVLGVASLTPGVTVGLEPRSADFGKLKIGNTRLDLTGGFGQYPRIVAQLVSGKIISSTTGKELLLGDPGKFRPLTRWDIILRFFENKMSPVASYVVGLLQQQNAIGQPFDPKQEALSRFVPMIVGDMHDAIAEWGAKGALVGVPAFFGAGVQTYGGGQKQGGTSSRSASIVVKGPKGDVTAKIPPERVSEFAAQLEAAESQAIQAVLKSPNFYDLTPARQESLLKGVVEKLQQQVRSRWLQANKVAVDVAVSSGAKNVELRSPEENDVLQAMRVYNRAARSGDQQRINDAAASLIRARASLVKLTSSEQAGLPAGLMPSREGALGLDADETSRVAAALLDEPEMQDAGVPATASPSEIVQFYWDTAAPSASPDEFRSFLRHLAAERPAQAPPTEGTQLESGSQAWWDEFHGKESVPSDEWLDEHRVSADQLKNANDAAEAARRSR